MTKRLVVGSRYQLANQRWQMELVEPYRWLVALEELRTVALSVSGRPTQEIKALVVRCILPRAIPQLATRECLCSEQGMLLEEREAASALLWVKQVQQEEERF